jgi:hypothetical protein
MVYLVVFEIALYICFLLVVVTVKSAFVNLSIPFECYIMSQLYPFVAG